MKLEWDFHELTDFADRLSDRSNFERFAEKITQEVAKVLLKYMKQYTPVEDGDLIAGWNGNNFLVTKRGNGFEVLIVNTTPYAPWVNDGHMAYNQYGGPYTIKRRVKVISPHKWQQGDATYYVFGHFFVERGILSLANSKQVESIIMQQLEQWWESV